MTGRSLASAFLSAKRWDDAGRALAVMSGATADRVRSRRRDMKQWWRRFWRWYRSSSERPQALGGGAYSSGGDGAGARAIRETYTRSIPETQGRGDQHVGRSATLTGFAFQRARALCTARPEHERPRAAQLPRDQPRIRDRRGISRRRTTETHVGHTFASRGECKMGHPDGYGFYRINLAQARATRSA